MLGDLRGVPFPPRNSGSFNFPAFSLYNKGNSGARGRTRGHRAPLRVIQKGVSGKVKRESLRGCKRIVVKVGTSSITYPTGKIDLEKMELLVRELSDLHNAGRELILVTH